MAQRPFSKVLLVCRQFLIAHATTANGECVEVRNDRLHQSLSVGNQKAMRIHWILCIHLIQNYLWCAFATSGVQVEVHELWLGNSARLPARQERYVLLHDVNLATHALWNVKAVAVWVGIDLFDSPLAFYRQFLEPRCQFCKCNISCNLGHVTYFESITGVRLFYQLLVFLLANLQEWDVTGHMIHSGRLPFYIQAFAHSLAAQHLGNCTSTARPVNSKPVTSWLT
mmetsp:Transcript_3535/g.6825  ORF Transcript_3535/g.6825 Transcript_3535/m.6825 type:complete len:226 (+) Transcript_3535:850-1527(+)